MVAAVALAFAAPAFAQRSSHPAGGPPAGHVPESNPGTGASHATTGSNHADISRGSPTTDVLSHNTAIAGKIKTLTGEDAQTACRGFKNIGQCVAAAHLAKNLSIPGGLEALRPPVTDNGVATHSK